jgi:hypothetical protein
MSHKSQTIGNIYFLSLAVMSLNKDEPVEAILLCTGHSQQDDLETFNTQEWSPITHTCVRKIV